MKPKLAVLLAIYCSSLYVHAASNTIEIQNDSYQFASIARIGDSAASTIIPPRILSLTISLDQVNGQAASATAQILLIQVSTNLTIPETSFQGFDGVFGQNCSLTIDKAGTSVSITYSQATKSSDSTNSNTGSTSGTAVASTDGTGSSGNSSGNNSSYSGTSGYRPSGTSASSSSYNNPPDTTAASTNTDEPPKHKILGSGVSVRLADSDNSFKPLELPTSPKGVNIGRPTEGDTVKPTLVDTHKAFSFGTLGLVLALILGAGGYIVFRVQQDRKKAKTLIRKR